MKVNKIQKRNKRTRKLRQRSTTCLYGWIIAILGWSVNQTMILSNWIKIIASILQSLWHRQPALTLLATMMMRMRFRKALHYQYNQDKMIKICWNSSRLKKALVNNKAHLEAKKMISETVSQCLLWWIIMENMFSNPPHQANKNNWTMRT